MNFKILSTLLRAVPLFLMILSACGDGTEIESPRPETSSPTQKLVEVITKAAPSDLRNLLLSLKNKSIPEAISFLESEWQVKTVLLAADRSAETEIKSTLKENTTAVDTFAYYQKNWGANFIFRRQRFSFLPPNVGEQTRPFRGDPVILIFSKDSIYYLFLAVTNFYCWKFEDGTNHFDPEIQREAESKAAAMNQRMQLIGMKPDGQVKEYDLVDQWVKLEGEILLRKINSILDDEELGVLETVLQTPLDFRITTEDLSNLKVRYRHRLEVLGAHLRDTLNTKWTSLQLWDNHLSPDRKTQLKDLHLKLIDLKQKLIKLEKF